MSFQFGCRLCDRNLRATMMFPSIAPRSWPTQLKCIKKNVMTIFLCHSQTNWIEFHILFDLRCLFMGDRCVLRIFLPRKFHVLSNMSGRGTTSVSIATRSTHNTHKYLWEIENERRGGCHMKLVKIVVPASRVQMFNICQVLSYGLGYISLRTVSGYVTPSR